MKRSDCLEEEAAVWLVAEDRGLGMREQAAFEAWLAQSPGHRVAYLRLKGAWRNADCLATRKGSLRRPRRALSEYVWSGPVRVALAGAALLACGAVGTALLIPSRQTIATAVGEHRSVKLSDGSQVELNTNTRLEVSEMGAARRVMLDYGQAYFEVVHDEKHPFVVLAGNKTITDIGTRFSIYRAGDDVKIVVADGEVRIDAADAPGAAPIFMRRDTVAVSEGGSTMLMTRGPGEVADDLAWRYGVVKFSDRPLEDVVRELNRYNRQQICVDASARDIRVGGSFRPDNLESFESILRQMFGVKVEERDGETHISK